MQGINIRVGQSDTSYLEGVKECEQSVSGKDIRRVGKERGKSEVIYSFVWERTGPLENS